MRVPIAMNRRHVAIVAPNLVVLVATIVALRAWAQAELGYFDPDMIGSTALLWTPLVIVATALAALALSLPAVRWIGLSSVVALGAIVVEQTAGALHDGAVSDTGLLTGALMALQVVVLGGSRALAVGRLPGGERRGTDPQGGGGPGKWWR